MRALASALLMLVAGPALAQTSPTLGADDPRLQTVAPAPGVPVRLVAFPDAPLTVVFLPGEQIERVVVSDTGAFDVAVVGQSDTVTMTPKRTDAWANVSVATNRQAYSFEVETGSGLAAAYVVRIVDGAWSSVLGQAAPPAGPDLSTMPGTYRVTGSRVLRPSAIADDGSKTYIRWGEYQAMPAVFGIGPTGGEEIVDGYMRGEFFTIDRVYHGLVFRIDKEKAQAQRREALSSQ